MTDKDNSIDHIPPIVPSRDEGAARAAASGKGRRTRSTPPSGGGGAGILARLFITISLAAAGVACGWAWQLQQELLVKDTILADYEARIGDLEDRLSDTDEGMNQSAAAMSVKIKELYSEVDKLWASAWRRNKAKIESLEKSASDHGSRLSTLANTDKAYSEQLKALASDVSKLRSVAGDLERLVADAKTNQELMERLGDELSRATLEVARLEKRVKTGEEWQQSVDGFRRQVNQSLIRLEERIAQVQGLASQQ